VDTRVATIFDNIGTAAEVLLELHEGDRVQVLAQSSDEIWTRIRIEDKHVGWIRTYRLVMAEASQTPTSTADTQVSPGFALRDDFENAESGWESETDENGSNHYSDGEYVISVTESGLSRTASFSPVFMDCEIEVEARPTVGEDCLHYELVFRSRGSDGYYFTVYPTGAYRNFRLLRVVDGQQKWLTEGYIESDAFYLGNQVNLLGVRANGPEISLFANGQLLLSITDTRLDGGRVSFEVHRHTYGSCTDQLVEVRFDNMIVRSLSQTVPTKPIPPSEDLLTPAPGSGPACQDMYTMEPSDTLFLISSKYGVSLPDLAAANGVRSWDELVGSAKTLCIPYVTVYGDTLTVDPTPVPESGCRFMHVVRKASDLYYQRDHLSYVSMRYGVSQEEIKAANGLEYSWPEEGTVLCIP